MAEDDIFADLLSSLQPSRTVEPKSASLNDTQRSLDNDAPEREGQKPSEPIKQKMPSLSQPLKKEEMVEILREATRELLFQSLGALTNTMRTSLAALSERIGGVEQQCKDMKEGLDKVQALHETGVEQVGKSLSEVTTALRDTGTHLQRVVDKQELVDAHVMLTKLQQEKEVSRNEQKDRDVRVSEAGDGKDLISIKSGGKDAPPAAEQPNPPTQALTAASVPPAAASQLPKEEVQSPAHHPQPIVSGAMQTAAQPSTPAPLHQAAPAPTPAAAPVPAPAPVPLPAPPPPVLSGSCPTPPQVSSYPQASPQFQQQQPGAPPHSVQAPTAPLPVAHPHASVPVQQVPPGNPGGAPVPSPPQMAQPPMPPAPQPQRMPVVSQQQTVLSPPQHPSYPGMQRPPAQQAVPQVPVPPLQQGPPAFPPQPMQMGPESVRSYPHVSMGMIPPPVPYRQGFPPHMSARPPPSQNPMQAPHAGEHGGPPGTRTTTQSVPLEQVIDDVAAMGFNHNRVRSIVTDMVNQGRSVDLNVVLDQLTRFG